MSCRADSKRGMATCVRSILNASFHPQSLSHGCTLGEGSAVLLALGEGRDRQEQIPHFISDNFMPGSLKSQVLHGLVGIQRF